MPEPLVFVDRSEILDGKLDELKMAAKEMAAFVEANEPRTIAYHVYVDEEPSVMTVVQVHPDSASMELHMTAARPIFRKFAGLLRMVSMDVYGTPSDELLEQVREKAEMLGARSVRVHEHHAGFARLGDPSGGR